ncbi:hypothetical protein LTR17_020051 [Elasticomyces elasticus]|nr:hypothetical protein LTR17_020051 [Elasticomyces elasticus]
MAGQLKSLTALAGSANLKDTWSLKPAGLLTPRACVTCGAGSQPDGKPLLGCKKCKTTYCSRTCQQQDWLEHKKVCKSRKVEGAEYNASLKKIYSSTPTSSPAFLIDEGPDERSGHAFTIVPKQDGEYDYQKVRQWPGVMRNSEGWVDLPLTQVLGFPLKLHARWVGGYTLKNLFGMRLGLIPFPDDPKFGESNFDDQAAGAVMIARVDGKFLHWLHLNIMLRYVTEGLDELSDVTEREKKGEKVDRGELAGRLLTPAAFVKFWEKLKASGVEENEENRQVWEGVDCPVELD